MALGGVKVLNQNDAIGTPSLNGPVLSSRVPVSLTAAYALREPNDREKAVLRDAYKKAAPRISQKSERKFLEAYFGLARQTLDLTLTKCLLCPSASRSIEVLAKHLQTVALMEPCFGRIPSIFKREGVKLEPIPEKKLLGPALRRTVGATSSSSIFVTSPNNPTGTACTKEQFEELVLGCKEFNKTLVVDNVFRFFGNPDNVVDQYEILNRSGIEFAMIEDTGKTWPAKSTSEEAWPTQGLKVSVLAMSPQLFKQIHGIYHDDVFTHFALPVTSFAVEVVTAILKNSVEDNLGSVRENVARNRGVLYRDIRDTFLTPEESRWTSLAWLKINKKNLTSPKLTHILQKQDIYVMPGTEYFWSNPKMGNKHIRIALARSPENFAAASAKIRAICQQIES